MSGLEPTTHGVGSRPDGFAASSVVREASRYPPGTSAAIARLLALPRGAMVELPSGVELDLFRRRPLDRRRRLAQWRRWLVEQPLGWDESGIPGSVAYQDDDLWPIQEAEAILLYVGRSTAVKRLPLLLRAHSQALKWLGRPLPLVLVGGTPGEWRATTPSRSPVHSETGNLPRRLAAPSRATGGAECRRPARASLRRRSVPARPRSWASYGWPLIVARVVDIYDHLAGRLDRQRAART
jgi:hypothetical protein